MDRFFTLWGIVRIMEPGLRDIDKSWYGWPTTWKSMLIFFDFEGIFV